MLFATAICGQRADASVLSTKNRPLGQAGGPLVYAAPTSRGVVNVYPGGQTKPTSPLYSFSFNPGVANSLVVDRRGNLFLADSYSTWVFEYAPGTSTPSKSFSTSETPFNIALHGSTLFVYEAMESGGLADVAVYEHGSTKVTRTLSDSAIVYPQGMAVDGAGDVFVGYSGSAVSQFGIGEFVGGRMPMVPLNLGGLYPLSLGVDPAGNLLVDAPEVSGLTSSISIFPPGRTTASATIDNLPWLYEFSLTADGRNFYAGDMGRDRVFQMYHYPSGRLIYRFKDPEAYEGFAGICASPAAEVGTW
jgi:hypothetical protein